jgi:hypothetical protein
MHQPFSTTHVPWRARLPWLPGTRNRRFRRLERSQPVPSTGKPNGELGTAVLFESGTTSSNPSSSSGESRANLNDASSAVRDHDLHIGSSAPACSAARPAVADYRSKFALDSLFRCAWSPLAGSDEFGELTSVHRRLLLGMSGCPRSERIPPSSQVLRHRNQRVWKEPVPARLSMCPSSKHLAVGILVNQRHVKQNRQQRRLTSRWRLAARLTGLLPAPR